MWVVQPGDGSPDDGVPGDGVPGDGLPDWDGADPDDATGPLDGPGLLGSDGGERLSQGLWLTASAPLPPGLMSSVAAGGGTGVLGFGQGGVLEALPPGPALAAFTAEAAGGICGTGVPDPEAADLDLGVEADGHEQHSEAGQLGQHNEAGQLGRLSEPGRLGQHNEAGQLGQHNEAGQLGRLSEPGRLGQHNRQANSGSTTRQANWDGSASLVGSGSSAMRS